MHTSATSSITQKQAIAPRIRRSFPRISLYLFSLAVAEFYTARALLSENKEKCFELFNSSLLLLLLLLPPNLRAVQFRLGSGWKAFIYTPTSVCCALTTTTTLPCRSRISKCIKKSFPASGTSLLNLNVAQKMAKRFLLFATPYNWECTDTHKSWALAQRLASSEWTLIDLVSLVWRLTPSK